MLNRIRLAMILFILSEGTFFALLICAYVFYHSSKNQGFEAARSLNVLKTGIFSLALFSSSATIWRTEVNLRRQRRRRMAGWLLATIVLGGIFLVGQGMEYSELLREHITISRNLFGTTFFTLTGFHGLHVFLGLVALSVLLGLTTYGDGREPTADAVEGVAIYWHFVDAVWVFIFGIVYLWRFA